MIFDCHTHWSDSFLDDPAADPTDPAPWLARLNEHGITHALVLPLDGLLDAGRIPADNQRIAEVCARSDGRMIPFCTLNLWFPASALAEATRCLHRLHVRGIKFHPWLQGASVNMPVMDDIAQLAAQAGVPILFHDGTPPFSLPSQIALLAARHPRTHFVLGHAGLFEHTREALAALRAAPNLWACLCGPTLAGCRQFLAQADLGRLLWGSDFGFGATLPFAYRLGLLEQAPLTDAQRQAILQDNPGRLLQSWNPPTPP